MKKIFITAIIFLIAILSAPIFTVSADSGELADIPIRGNSKSGKAYCLYDEKDGVHTLNYINSEGTKLLYKSKKKFRHATGISEDGKIVFYIINNTMYRYSYESGELKRIYTVKKTGKNNYAKIQLYVSPNGEYCFICALDTSEYDDRVIDIVAWHDGKTVSHNEKLASMVEKGGNLQGINNRGEIFCISDRDIYALDFEGKMLSEKAPGLSPGEDQKNLRYEAEVFKESGTYMIRCNNDIYYGQIGKERYKLSFPDQPQFYIAAKNGKGFIAHNGEYVSRYDMKKGASSKIFKISPEKFSGKQYRLISVSSDLDKVVFIDHSEERIVQLSHWSSEKNRYIGHKEIQLDGTGEEMIGDLSYDMNSVLVYNADEKGHDYQADFESGSFAPCEYWYWKTDRFGHRIKFTDKKVKIIDPDGGETVVFDGVGTACIADFSNGFLYFYSGGPDTVCNYEGEYDLTYYYIDENGKAVKWYEEKSVYMECHEIEDWDSWEE